jgi:hypothetical protein
VFAIGGGLFPQGDEVLGLSVVHAGFVLGAALLAVRGVVRLRRFGRGTRKDPGGFRARVDVRYMLPSGFWAFKTLGAELVIKSPVIEVATVSGRLGAVLGSEWIFQGGTTRCEVGSAPVPRARNREWIIMSSTQDGGPRTIAISPGVAIEEVLLELKKCGAEIVQAA